MLVNIAVQHLHSNYRDEKLRKTSEIIAKYTELKRTCYRHSRRSKPAHGKHTWSYRNIANNKRDSTALWSTFV